MIFFRVAYPPHLPVLVKLLFSSLSLTALVCNWDNVLMGIWAFVSPDISLWGSPDYSTGWFCAFHDTKRMLLSLERQMRSESGCFVDTASGNWSHEWLFTGVMQPFLGRWDTKLQALTLHGQQKDQSRVSCHKYLKPGFHKTHLWTACRLALLVGEGGPLCRNCVSSDVWLKYSNSNFMFY